MTLSSADQDDKILDLLRRAVNLARHEDIRDLKTLRTRLSDENVSDDLIDKALKMWADYEKLKVSSVRMAG